MVAPAGNDVRRVLRQYQCRAAGCGATILAHDEEALVEAVQRHMTEEHGSFELEDVIIDMSSEVEESEGEQS